MYSFASRKILNLFILALIISPINSSAWSLDSITLGSAYFGQSWREKNTVNEISEVGEGGAIIVGLQGTIYHFENWSTHWKFKNQLSMSETIYSGYIQSFSGFEKYWSQKNEWQDFKSTIQIDGLVPLNKFLDIKVVAGLDALYRSRDLQQYKEIFKTSYPIVGGGLRFKASDELHFGFEALSSINASAQLIVPRFMFSKKIPFHSISKNFVVSWMPKKNLDKDEWQLSFGRETFKISPSDSSDGLYFPGGHDERKSMSLSWIRHWK